MLGLRRIIVVFITTVVDLIAPEKSSVRAYKNMSAVELRRFLSPATPPPHRFLSALFSYKDPRVREIVWEIKYRRHSALTEKIGVLLCEHVRESVRASMISGKKIILAPVSSSAARRRERGFNQCEILCEAIMKSAATHTPDLFQYEPQLLVKIKHTPHQADLPRAARLKNIVGAYAVRDPDLCRGLTVYIVDDVITTGATLCEARRALLEAGAGSVSGFAIAH